MRRSPLRLWWRYLVSPLPEYWDGVLSVKDNGDTHLGVDDLRSHHHDWLNEEVRKENGIDISKDMMALRD